MAQHDIMLAFDDQSIVADIKSWVVVVNTGLITRLQGGKHLRIDISGGNAAKVKHEVETYNQTWNMSNLLHTILHLKSSRKVRPHLSFGNRRQVAHQRKRNHLKSIAQP